MLRERKSIAFETAEFKVNSDKRTVEMYSARFGNVDLGGDVIHEGAFKRTLTERRDDSGKKAQWRIPMLWQHLTDVPIGNPTELREDSDGLYSKDFLPDTGHGCPGTRALILAKEGVVRGASIGYSPVDFRYDGDDVRHLYDLELYERSIVTFPMNEQAGVTNVRKDALQLLSPELQLKVSKVLLSEVDIRKFEKAVALLLDIISAPEVDGDWYDHLILSWLTDQHGATC